jgi:L-amino acid N-acyltransferase YncA
VPDVVVRAATPDDTDAVTAIYNEGIEDRQATFETRLREPAEVAAWFGAGLPFLVAQDGDGTVVGWARVSPYSDRCVYEGVGEHGV